MTGLVVLAILVIVAMAIVVVLSAVRRREMGRAVGQLSRESIKRDQARRKELASVGAPTGTAVERAAVDERKADLVAASATAPTVWVAPDPETYGVTRRQFLNRSIIGVMVLAISTFAAVSQAVYLWPTGSSGFGGKIRIGKLSDILSDIDKGGGFLYKPEGRMWVTAYPKTALPKARLAYKGLGCLPGMEAGIVALYQKCVHLGCRVPSCSTSKWFECPCHGSQYNLVGEKKGGPAPRGLDRFPVAVEGDGTVIVDTASSGIILGPAIGINTTGQEAEGPHCVG